MKLKWLIIGTAIGFLIARWWMENDVQLTAKERARLKDYDTSEADMEAFMRETKARKAQRNRRDVTSQADDVLRRYVGDES